MRIRGLPRIAVLQTSTRTRQRNRPAFITVLVWTRGGASRLDRQGTLVVRNGPRSSGSGESPGALAENRRARRPLARKVRTPTNAAGSVGVTPPELRPEQVRERERGLESQDHTARHQQQC